MKKRFLESYLPLLSLPCFDIIFCFIDLYKTRMEFVFFSPNIRTNLLLTKHLLSILFHLHPLTYKRTTMAQVKEKSTL